MKVELTATDFRYSGSYFETTNFIEISGNNVVHCSNYQFDNAVWNLSYVSCYDSSETLLSQTTLDTRFSADVSNSQKVKIRIQLFDNYGNVVDNPNKIINITLEFGGWFVDETKGLVHDTNPTVPTKFMTKPYPYQLWRIEANVNGYFPFHKLLPDVPINPAPKPVYQPEYITVHDMEAPQDGFDNHGLAILRPSSCTETETLNGEWTVTLTHPIDLEGRWKYILERNILKVHGQLFTIVKVEHEWRGNKGSVTATAEHIFYQLNDGWIYPGSRIAADNALDVMRYADYNMERNFEPGQTLYIYDYSSDLTIPQGVDTNQWNPLSDGCTFIDIILGNNGIANICNGELYRNNFYFSVKQRMENANDNAFEIRLGHNLRGIRRNVDVSTMVAYFRAYDTYGNWFAVSWDASTMPRAFPHSIIRSKNYSFNIDEATLPDGWTEVDKIERSMGLLEANAMAYFNSYCSPLVSYTVDIEDVSHNPDFEEIKNHYEYKVGNKGKIVDIRLGEPIELMITQTVTDRVKNKVTQVNFGDLRSFTRPSGYKTAITSLSAVPENLDYIVRDSEGNPVFDSEGYQIAERR